MNNQYANETWSVFVPSSTTDGATYGIDAIGENGCRSVVIYGECPDDGGILRIEDARLIAASPKLLSALQDLLDVVTGQKEGDAIAVMNAQSAINEATGRTE